VTKAHEVGSMSFQKLYALIRFEETIAELPASAARATPVRVLRLPLMLLVVSLLCFLFGSLKLYRCVGEREKVVCVVLLVTWWCR
jgi:hypothetical protein